MDQLAANSTEWHRLANTPDEFQDVMWTNWLRGRAARRVGAWVGWLVGGLRWLGPVGRPQQPFQPQGGERDAGQVLDGFEGDVAGQPGRVELPVEAVQRLDLEGLGQPAQRPALQPQRPWRAGLGTGCQDAAQEGEV